MWVMRLWHVGMGDNNFDGSGWMFVMSMGCGVEGNGLEYKKSQRIEDNKNLPWIGTNWLRTRSFHRRNLKSICCFH